MTRTLSILLVTFGWSVSIPAKGGENPVAAQFRLHMTAADVNHDGFVSKEELIVEISKGSNADGGDPEIPAKIASEMMRDLDSNGDGRLSAAEIEAGASKAAAHAILKDDVTRAEVVMEALVNYRKTHGGSLPPNLDELAKLQLVPKDTLHCTFADRSEKPWNYVPGVPGDVGPNSAILFSPAPIEPKGQYIVGLADGRVIGMDANDFESVKPYTKGMQVYPDR